MYAKNKANVKLNPEYIACSWDDALTDITLFLLGMIYQMKIVINGL